MNGCTPTFSSNKLCLLGITLRKWRATVANPTVPLAHVLRLFTRSLKLPYRRDYALTRANVEDVWMPRKTFANRIYIYIRFPIFQLYLSRIETLYETYRASETLLLDKSSVSSSGSLEKNRVFTEGFSTWSFATRNEFEIASRIHGFRIVTSGKGRTWIHLVEKLSLMVYRSVDVSSTSS